VSYYVYALIDPRDNETFYIGKGKRGRAYQHLDDAKKPVRKGTTTNLRKRERILSIVADGMEPRVSILKRFKGEIDALEAELIASMPLLTNIAKGGVHGGAFSRAEMERRTELAVTRLLLKEWKVRRQPPFIALAGHPKAVEINQSFNQMVSRLLNVQIPYTLVGRTLCSKAAV
jgi:hypothetical protein